MDNSSSVFKPMDNVDFVFKVQQQKFVFLENWLLVAFGGNDGPQKMLESLHADDLPVLQRAYTNLMDGTFKGSVKFRVGDGEHYRWINVTPFFDRLAQLIYGCAIDISAEVDNLDSMTRYTNKKNSVLHMLAHDLRGPLDIARSLVVQMANSTADDQAKKKSETIATILQQSVELITNLTNREFIEMVGADLVKRRIDLVQKLNDYLEECRRSAELTERTFLLESTEKSAMAEVDEAKFMQVVNNLMSNALKFTTPGSTITVKLAPRADRLLLTFSDTGIGIPEEMLPNLFDRFTKAARVGLKGEATRGLGPIHCERYCRLASRKNLVRKH